MILPLSIVVNDIDLKLNLDKIFFWSTYYNTTSSFLLTQRSQEKLHCDLLCPLFFYDYSSSSINSLYEKVWNYVNPDLIFMPSNYATSCFLSIWWWLVQWLRLCPNRIWYVAPFIEQHLFFSFVQFNCKDKQE